MFYRLKVIVYLLQDGGVYTYYVYVDYTENANLFPTSGSDLESREQAVLATVGSIRS